MHTLYSASFELAARSRPASLQATPVRWEVSRLGVLPTQLTFGTVATKTPVWRRRAQSPPFRTASMRWHYRYSRHFVAYAMPQSRRHHRRRRRQQNVVRIRRRQPIEENRRRRRRTNDGNWYYGNKFHLYSKIIMQVRRMAAPREATIVVVVATISAMKLLD